MLQNFWQRTKNNTKAKVMTKRQLYQLYTYPMDKKATLPALRNHIQQGAARDGAHKYGTSTHVYSWVERGTI